MELVPSRPKESSEEPVSSRISERIKKHHYESVGLLQFHITIYKHIPICILISKKVGMLSSGQTMAGKKKSLRSLRQCRGEVLLSCIQKSKHWAQGQKKRDAVIIWASVKHLWVSQDAWYSASFCFFSWVVSTLSQHTDKLLSDTSHLMATWKLKGNNIWKISLPK